MAGTTIGTAYVQILPSAQGIKGNLTKALGGELGSAGKGLANRLGGGLVNGLKTVGVAAGAALAAGIGSAVTIGKQSLANFKEYEQLAGGAQLMFGDAYDTVAENAATAFKRVQMSQNEYLRQANGFATGLKKNLGGDGQAAADLADRIMQAEADIVAATGKDAESVQNAFNGIMRNNLTMVDNLGLGAELATKKGFAAMMKEVNAWNKANGKATKYQMGNVADMESALVDYVEMMGYAGYAQKEAAGTIEGSLASTKAAWSDLLTGMADNDADMDSLINNLIDSATNLATLILPRIQTIADGFSQFLTTALPIITPIITQFITDNLPTLVDAGIQIFLALVTGFITAIPQLVESLPMIFESIKQAFIENGPALEQAGKDLFFMIGNGVNNALSAAGNYISTHFGEWCASAGELAQNFGATMSAGFQELSRQISLWINQNLIMPANDAVQGFIDCGRQVVDNIKEGIKNAWDGVATWFKNLWNSLFGNLKANIHVTKSGSPAGAGSFATGLDYVPYDEFPAILHKGEAVLTADEANVWRNGGKGMTINQYIQSVPQTPVQLAAATAAQFEMARWAI